MTVGAWAVALPGDFARGSTYGMARPLAMFLGVVVAFGAVAALGLVRFRGHAAP